MPRPTQLISSLPFRGKAITAFVPVLVGGIAGIVAIFLAASALVLGILGFLTMVLVFGIAVLGYGLSDQFSQVGSGV